MSDLINRQAAIDAILKQTVCATKRELVEICDANISDENGWLGGICIALDTIEDLPSAQPEQHAIQFDSVRISETGVTFAKRPERQKGEWRHYEGMYSCNQCGSAFYDMSPFCSNCGADMRGEQDATIN